MLAELFPLAGSWLLTYLLHSTLLLGTAWVITHRLIRSPALRDLTWKTALVGGLMTATVQVGSGWQPLGGAVVLTRSAPATVAPTNTPEAWQGIMPETRASAAPKAAAQHRATADLAPAAAPAPATLSEPVDIPTSTTAPSTSGPSLLAILLAAWFVAGAAMLGRYLVQRAKVLRRIGPRRPVQEPVVVAMLETLRHIGKVAQPIQLTSASGLTSPVALGRDEIALPDVALTDLDREQQRSMLAHELAHLVRRDPSWLAVACVIERLFFIQPLNRLARFRMQEAAELLCDDWAVHRTGSGFSLASCLVKVAEWVDTPPHPVPLAGMAEHRSQLVTRIHRLIEGRPMTTAPRSLWFAAGAVALLGVTAVAAPGVTSHGTPPAVEADNAEDVDQATAMELAALAGVSDTDSVIAATGSNIQERRMELLERAAQVRSMRAASADIRREMSRSRVAWARAPRPPRAPYAIGAPMAPMAPMAPPAAIASAEARAFGYNSWSGHERRQDTTSIAVPALITALKDSDVEVRRVAVQSLANFDDPRAVPGLVGALKDSDAEVRIGAAMALGHLGDERALPGLLGALKDGDKEVRRSALSALQSMPKVPDEAILTALTDSDTEVRQEAINLAVSRMSDHDDDENVKVDPRYVAAFGKLLVDANADIRQEAAHGLGSAGLTEPPAALLTAAKDKSSDVREAVADALGSIASSRGVPTLKEMLADGNADVRERAIQSLSQIRDQSALEALVGALKSTDPVVRRSAAEALGSRDDQ